MSEPAGYHCSIAIGHYARALQAEGRRRGRYHTVAVLQALWLLADPLASAPVVAIDMDDLAGIVPSAGRLRQIVCELASVGAVERLESLDRSYRLFKPDVEALDEIARAKLQAADTAPSQPVTSSGPTATSAERREVLARLGKKPSDVRDVLASMAGLDRSALRYSGRGSGPVQAASAWLAETGRSWEAFELLCDFVRRDPNKPRDAEWLFGREHVEYRERAIATLKAEHARRNADASASAPTTEPERPKLLSDSEPEVVRAWLGKQVRYYIGDEQHHRDAVEQLWADERARVVLLGMTGAAATERLMAWKADTSQPLTSHFA